MSTLKKIPALASGDFLWRKVRTYPASLRFLRKAERRLAIYCLSTNCGTKLDIAEQNSATIKITATNPNTGANFSMGIPLSMAFLQFVITTKCVVEYDYSLDNYCASL